METAPSSSETPAAPKAEQDSLSAKSFMERWLGSKEDDRLKRYIRYLVVTYDNRLGEKDVEDIHADTLLGLFSALTEGTYDEQRASHLTFAKVIAHNCFRRTQRNLYLAKGVAPVKFSDLERPDGSNPAEHVEVVPPECQPQVRLMPWELRALLKRLPARESDALRLHYLDGKKQEEAAEEMGISYAYFRKILERARESAWKLASGD